LSNKNVCKSDYTTQSGGIITEQQSGQNVGKSSHSSI